MLTLIRPRLRKRSDRRRTARLMSDVDRVWLREGQPSGDSSYLVMAGIMEPQDAVDMLRQVFDAITVPTLDDQLDVLGIAVGDLSSGDQGAAPVGAVWRSTLPVLLVTPAAKHDPEALLDIATAIGRLVYGSRISAAGSELATDFARLLEPSLSRS